MNMFEKFGRFSSAKELNKAAAGLLEEGDQESIFLLAEENGIDKEDAEDYIAGDLPELASVSSAAYGRITIEERAASGEKEVSTRMALHVILTMLKGMCTDECIAKAVMKKRKSASGILDAMKKEAQRHKTENMAVACGTDRQLCEIIRIYYTGSSKELKEALEGIYKEV